MNDIGWDYYRTFLAVLRAGSLSAGARDLGLTQPTVGRHVEALEQALGYPLFTRSQQGLGPTDAALALAPYAETLASTAAAMARHATGTSGEIAGTVRISASDVIGIEVLPPILADLQEEHPQLVIELSLSDAVEDLLRRESDIAIRMTNPSHDALVAQRIGSIPVGLHAHKRYLDRHGIPKSPADLTAHRFIGFDRRTSFIRAMESRFQSDFPLFPALNELNWSYRIDSNVAQLAAIRAGAGIGMCQIGIAERDPDLVRILPDVFELPLETWVVMHENLRSGLRWRKTFDALVKGLRDYVKATARPD
ncbi:MAG: LysR family transcriptional regulator [Pseudorhizobium sp.]